MSDEQEELGFRSEERQKEAMKRFHEEEERRKQELEKKKLEELKAKEQAVFDATKKSVQAFKNAASRKAEEERKKKEKAAKLLVANAFSKHHNLRKSLREQEEKKKEEEERKKKKREAKRAAKLAAQAAKMAKFEEDQRWKTLPAWQKEREEELLNKVSRLVALDSSRSKYDFFDVHRPEAWDIPKLDEALESTEAKKGLELFNELQKLKPNSDQSEFYDESSDPKWAFSKLKSSIEEEKRLIEIEEREGLELFQEYEDLNSDALRDDFYTFDGRPRWKFEELKNAIKRERDILAENKEQGETLFGTLSKYLPDGDAKSFQSGVHERWNIDMLEEKIAAEKKRWEEEDRIGEEAFTVLKSVDPKEKREDYYFGEDAPSPWDLSKITETRAGRIRLLFSVGVEDGESEQTVILTLESTYGDLKATICQQIDKAPECVTIVYKGEKLQNEDQSLQDAKIIHNEKLFVIVSEQKRKTETPVAEEAGNIAEELVTLKDETPDEEEEVPLEKPSPCCIIS